MTDKDQVSERESGFEKFKPICEVCASHPHIKEVHHMRFSGIQETTEGNYYVYDCLKCGSTDVYDYFTVDTIEAVA
ncbi:MAG: hypothetical protein ACTSPB_00135 [Candidatus Thorarchaeota archaeon]